MFGHILKCKYIPSEQLHPDIWKGANRRFKRTPWNKIEKKKEAEMTKGGKLQALVNKSKELQHDLVKRKTVIVRAGKRYVATRRR